MVNRNKCTASTTGIVTNKRSLGIEEPTVISVAYEIDGIKYEIKETIKLKNEWIKIGFLPIGQRQRPVMGVVKVGDVVDVSYNPDDPKKAFIINNVGKMS